MSTHIIAPSVGRVTTEARTTESPKSGQVIVAAAYTAISPGTELAWIHHAPKTPGVYPYEPGYSGCGTVVAVGEGVGELAVGDRVAARLFHASHQQVAAIDCHQLPAGCDLRALCPFHLATIALYGVRRAGVALGDTVVVCGLGPIGLMAAQLARVAGARRVIGIDPLASRRELADRCGIETAAPDQLPPATAAVVIEASGVPAVLLQALALCAEGGRVALLGSPRGLVDGLDAYALIHRANVSLIGAHLWGRPDPLDHIRAEEAEVVDLALQERIQLDVLISDEVAPADCASLYEDIRQHPADHLVPVFDWSQA